MKITEKVMFCVGEERFDTREDAELTIAVRRVNNIIYGYLIDDVVGNPWGWLRDSLTNIAWLDGEDGEALQVLISSLSPPKGKARLKVVKEDVDSTVAVDGEQFFILDVYSSGDNGMAFFYRTPGGDVTSVLSEALRCSPNDASQLVRDHSGVAAIPCEMVESQSVSGLPISSDAFQRARVEARYVR